MSCLVDGDPKAPILIVGMSPGREELVADRPFVGGSGRLLWALARRAGFGREHCYIVNTIGEWPDKKDGNPSAEQLERWWDEVDAALRASEAKVAICLGRVAFDRLTGICAHEKKQKIKTGIEAWRGYIVEPDEVYPQLRVVTRWGQYKTSRKNPDGTWKYKKGDPKKEKHKVVEPAFVPPSVQFILPTIHPAAVLRSGYANIPALAADLARAGRALRGQLRNGDFAWDTSPRRPTAGEPCSLDIETVRDPGAQTDIITRIGAAFGDEVWTHEWDKHTKDVTQAIAADPSVVKIFHNASYDIPRLESEGVEFAGEVFDTMTAAVVLQPDLYKGLNAVASLYLDVKRWKHLSDSQPEFYNATDNRRQLDLYNAMVDELRATGQYAWFTGTIMPAERELIKMSTLGVRLHAERREKWLLDLTREIDDLFEKWSALTGATDRGMVDPDSPAQVAALMYDWLELPTQYGKSGGRTVDAAALKELKVQAVRFRSEEAVEIIDTLLAYRKVTKLRSTYAKNPLGDDGCVHPSYLPAAKDDDREEFGKGMAGTLRLTSRNPNLFNQPPPARKLYIAHEPGMVLIEADYSQLELRITAALSKDSALAEALKGDVHARTMELLKCDRTRAKNIMYGTLYGGGPRKLVKVFRAQGYDISEAEVKALQNSLARAYPDMWAWRQHVINTAARQYYLTTPFGQRRYFWQGRKDAPAALDFLPQGTAAGIFWKIIVPMAEAMRALDGAMLFGVYDSTLSEVPRGNVVRAVAAITEVMEQRWDNIAPGFVAPIDIKVSEDSWATSTKDWHEGDMIEWSKSPLNPLNS